MPYQLAALAYFALGFHVLMEGASGRGAGSRASVPGVGSGRLGHPLDYSGILGGRKQPPERQRQILLDTRELAAGSPALQRPAKGTLVPVRNLEDRIKRIRGLIRKGAVDPAIRKTAIAVLSQRDPKKPGGWKVAEKDWRGEADALFGFVRKNVRYTKDSALADTYVHPARTLLDRGNPKGSGGGADCLPEDTLLLTDDFRLVPISQIAAGTRIWGRDAWTTVEAVWEKGDLPLQEVRIANGSAFRCTADHKVYVLSCEKHGPTCPDIVKGWRNCLPRGVPRGVARIHASELQPGMALVTPERIAWGKDAQDPRRAYVEGLYLADGWSSHEGDFAIAGKDGCPKAAQKAEVAGICAELGLRTRLHPRYVTVLDRTWTTRLRGMGSHAWEKHAASIDLAEPAARELLHGILADSGENSASAGRTFTSTSRTLTLQARVLLKMQGRSCGERYVPRHGGLGTHPIWRLQVWDQADGRKQKLLRVKSVRPAGAAPCWDIQTSDHYVYLPEADVTVSNCDDYAITLGSLLMSVGHNVKLRVAAVKTPDNPRPGWNHIWLCDVLPSGGAIAGSGGPEYPLDASINRPPGWQAPKERLYRIKDFEI